jgi:hypothetical protein
MGNLVPALRVFPANTISLLPEAQSPFICVGLKRDDPVLCWSDKKKLWDGPMSPLRTIKAK